MLVLVICLSHEKALQSEVRCIRQLMAQATRR